MSETWRLYQLQRADSRLAEIEKALGALRGDDAHLRRFAEAEAAWQEAESDLRRLKKELKEREHEDSILRDRRKALEGKLYGGRISNPKELSDFQKELENVKERVDVLEEDMLARMEDLETREAALEKLREEGEPEWAAPSQTELQDGLKYRNRDRWVYVRVSATEPLIRVIAEAPSQGEADWLARDFMARIKRLV